MTIVGTRPEIIRLSRVIAELDRHVDHVLVHTGQNFDYELNEIFFEQLGIRKPDHFLKAAKATAAQTIGNIIATADAVMAKEKPDALLLAGRHKLQPVRDRRQAPQDTGLSHGGRQPLLRRAGAGRTQPPDRRSHQRHQSDLHRARAALSAARGHSS